MNRSAWISTTALAFMLAFIPVLARPETVKQELKFTLPPLKLSQGDLLTILRGVHGIIRTANQASESANVQERLSISGDGTTITLDGDPRLSQPFAEIDIANSVVYSYFTLTGVVTWVRIDLRSFQREVSVEGTSREQVEALAAFIRQSFDRHTTWFGGLRGNLTVGLVLYIVVLLIITVLHRRYGFFASQVDPFAISIPAALLPTVTMWFDWFPGVSIYKADASFLVRYSAFISFLGLVATIVTAILGTYVTILYSHQRK